MVLKAATGVARESYDRCCKAPEFLDAFYKNFLAACPEAKAMFARTNFTQQTKLLRHAIGLLPLLPNHPRARPGAPPRARPPPPPPPPHPPQYRADAAHPARRAA